MNSDPASGYRTIAVNYTLRELYPSANSADIVGMEAIQDVVRVGVRVSEPAANHGPSYATVSIDENGRVRLANTCTERELYERLGRRSPAERESEQRSERRREFAEQKQELEEMTSIASSVSEFLFGKKSVSKSSPPAKCPRCDKSRLSYGFHLWKKVKSDVYNCRNCGYMARLNVEAEHVHEHESLGDYDDK